MTIGLIAVVLVLVAFGAHRFLARDKYTKYTDSFFDTFDTIITVVAYTESEAEFRGHFERIHERFLEFHRLYDIYTDYPDLNNAKTINDNAGVRPVEVDRQLIDLILFAKDWHERTGGKTNIAMGSVLKIWHDYREQAEYDPQNARIPPMSLLTEAAEHTDIQKVIVDEDESTVYLADSAMRLDLGAVAKGYATEVVANEVIAEGLVSAIISSGGNVRVIGKPLDGVRERWGIGIQDPQKSIFSEEESLLDILYTADTSVVSSGDYQRYYVVDGKIVHHLIDPATLMPAEHYHAVTVVAPDSGAADFLSTTLFLMTYEESRALAESLDDLEAMWVMPDGHIEMTGGMKEIASSGGASGADAGR